MVTKHRVGSSIAQSSGGVGDSFSGVNVDEALPDVIHGGDPSQSPNASPDQINNVNSSPFLAYFDIRPNAVA